MNKSVFKLMIIIIVVILITPFSVFAAGPPEGKGGGEEPTEETAGNNLSFPVIAVDGFASNITAVDESLTVAYTGPYTGLDDEELAIATGDTWYAQKVTGNTWQAGHLDSSGATHPVTYIDWSDNIESLNPKVGRSFRLELVLFHALDADKDGTREDALTGYTMAVLAFPSSPDEVQGTNGETYPADWATVISSKPKFVVQNLGNAVPADIAWSGSQWTGTGVGDDLNIAFAPELNVGGKYIFGASEGGWKPATAGIYRLTFYIPNDCTIDLDSATTGGDYGAIPSTTVATAVVDATNNLTYIDVTVVSGGGGGGKRPS